MPLNALLSVLAGLAVAIVVIVALELGGGALWLQSRDDSVVAGDALFWLLQAAAWFSGALMGGFVAGLTRLWPRRSSGVMLGVALSGLWILAATSQARPMWFILVPVLGLVPFSWLGHRFGQFVRKQRRQ